MKKATERVYEQIQVELDKNPRLSVAALCKSKNASYSGFRYWSARRETNATRVPQLQKQPTTPEQPLTIGIAAEAVMHALVSGMDTISLNVKEIIDSLTPEQAKELLSRIRTKT